MKSLKITIHWSFLVLGILMAIYGKLPSFLCCLACVILHEMGHSVVGRKLGYKLNMITLMPYGAMLSGKNSIFKSQDEIKIAIAGPLVNVFLILFCIIIWCIFPSIYNFTYLFVLANIYTFCFNLLPAFPLDGGRILNAVLSKKTSKIKAEKTVKIIGYIITSILFILFFISFFYKLNYMLGINALFLLIAQFDENTSPYYLELSNLDENNKNMFFKTLKLDKSVSLYLAYKKLIDNNVSTILVLDKNNVIAKLPRKKIVNAILQVPIDTKLENLTK